MTDEQKWEKAEQYSDQDVSSILFVEDEPEKADIILVFGHCTEKRSRQRARKAGQLYREGFAENILLMGGKTEKIHESEIMADELVNKQGLPADAIIMEKTSQTTKSNLDNAKKELGDHFRPDLKVILVSCPWHMARVKRQTEKKFADWQLFCCPHKKSCNKDSWADCDECRELIRGDRKRNKRAETFFAVKHGVL